MTAPARLLSVRLQGFKSFAERTHVTFGPGISAIVGPNGSGKSNLADALRWALGEQGRALRSRRAEDVIWAGSERRPALGMADVQLTLDNGDALLPVEYGVVELGRRLFRSGENDYLLNRQRVRLRDLVDLLDGANLAENAFLFIGQGMVDQALSLRPEERRPLFEEVAGVRRPERRRRRAEDQLAEAEANLARVEDILGELRPQASRLAQQAEQQTSRRSAADELAEAILLAAHSRWHAAARRVADATSAETRSRTAADRAMAELARHEGAAAEIAGRLTGRATVEAERRAAVDRTREALTTLRLRDGRLAAESEGLDRDRRRLASEGDAAAADLAAAREVTALPGAPADAGGDALPAIEAELAAAREELASLDGRGAPDAGAATVRRLIAVRAAEHEAAVRRAADAARVAVEERSRADDQVQRAGAANAARATIGERLATAIAEESTARAAREAAQARRDEAEAERRHVLDRASAARASLAAAEARADEARRQLDADDADAFRVAARAGGGRPVDGELAVEPSLDAAVDAALAELGRGVVVRRGAIEALLGQRGLAIVAEALEPPDPRRSGARREPPEDAFLAAVRGHGGGLLAEAVRRDGSGAARRLLARAAWLPDAATCLELQASMPPGWITVASDGSLVVRALTASIRPDGGSIRRRSDLERRITAAAETRSTAAAAERALAAAAALAEEATRELAAAQAAETAALARRRRLEEEDRAAAGAATSAAREAAWLVAQAERLEAQAERLRTEATERAAAVPTAAVPNDDVADVAEGAARAALERRILELAARRDRLAADVAAAAAARTEADRRRARAEAATTLAERRRDDVDRATAALAERDAALTAERDSVAGSIAAAARSLAAAEEALQAVLGEGAADREQLRAAEAAAAAARGSVRDAEDRARRAERDQLEARLALESLRESLLVDLAGLGALGLRHLTGTATGGAEADPRPAAEAAAALADDVEPDDLEAALAAAAERWQASPPASDAPSPGRIAVLRRRFHELGAGNPFAVEEYAEVKARLDTLEAQRSDLLAAIDQTQSLIRELERLIGDQFRTTFAALERAFDERFRQLFGGGFARLALTDPEDLTSTGVEITARPPGKKPQALAMLSGGERALTAVALLFAMLEVRPVPFCVLDEVDAALDEANIGRFTEALRELSARTQCIVITHNRGTIEIADALYGVTVGDDSVSRVISLRLDEATELASRNGERADAVAPGDPDPLAEPPLVIGG